MRYDDVVEAYRLDYKFMKNGVEEMPFTSGGNKYAVMEFPMLKDTEIDIPFGKKLGGTHTVLPPMIGNGFTGSSKIDIPEYVIPYDTVVRIPDKTEIYVVEDGVKKLYAVFKDGSFNIIK